MPATLRKVKEMKIRNAVDPIEFDGCRINIKETYDFPIMPVFTLVDDIEKVIVKLDKDHQVKEYYNYSIKPYPESHHTE